MHEDGIIKISAENINLFCSLFKDLGLHGLFSELNGAYINHFLFCQQLLIHCESIYKILILRVGENQYFFFAVEIIKLIVGLPLLMHQIGFGFKLLSSFSHMTGDLHNKHETKSLSHQQGPRWGFYYVVLVCAGMYMWLKLGPHSTVLPRLGLHDSF